MDLCLTYCIFQCMQRDTMSYGIIICINWPELLPGIQMVVQTAGVSTQPMNQFHTEGNLKLYKHYLSHAVD